MFWWLNETEMSDTLRVASLSYNYVAARISFQFSANLGYFQQVGSFPRWSSSLGCNFEIIPQELLRRGLF